MHYFYYYCFEGESLMYNVTGSYAKFGKEQMFAVGFISSGISIHVLLTVQHYLRKVGSEGFNPWKLGSFPQLSSSGEGGPLSQDP